MVTYKNQINNLSTTRFKAEELYMKLRKEIICGDLESGKKLTEQGLCQEYELSRTPVREVLKHLELDGLIKNIPNRGAFVTGFTNQERQDLYTLRKLYELQGVQWAIERITAEEFEALEEAVDFMEFYTEQRDIKKLVTINSNFHQIIYESTKNRLLGNILSSFKTYIKDARSPKSYSIHNIEPILKEHKEIFMAIKEKDPARGVEAMSIHIDHAIIRAKDRDLIQQE